LLDKTNKNITKHVVWIESLNYKKCQAWKLSWYWWFNQTIIAWKKHFWLSFVF
jgi:hypothetical protein